MALVAGTSFSIVENNVFYGGKRYFLTYKTVFRGIGGHAMWYQHLILIYSGNACCSFLSFLHHLFHHYCCILTVFAHLLPPPTLLPPLQKCFVHRHFKRRVAEWQQNSKN